MLPVDKLESLRARHRELEDLLCQPAVIADGKRYTKLLREKAELDPLVAAWTRYRDVERRLAEDKAMLADADMRDLAAEEIPQLETELASLIKEVQQLLLPTDPNDTRNTILEIRSGAGGEEAALFAADLFRMYSRYAERTRWRVAMITTP